MSVSAESFLILSRSVESLIRMYIYFKLFTKERVANIPFPISGMTKVSRGIMTPSLPFPYPSQAINNA
jgi:hypothetical protein